MVWSQHSNHELNLNQSCISVPKNLGATSNSRRKKGDVKQVFTKDPQILGAVVKIWSPGRPGAQYLRTRDLNYLQIHFLPRETHMISINVVTS